MAEDSDRNIQTLLIEVPRETRVGAFELRLTRTDTGQEVAVGQLAAADFSRSATEIREIIQLVDALREPAPGPPVVTIYGALQVDRDDDREHLDAALAFEDSRRRVAPRTTHESEEGEGEGARLKDAIVDLCYSFEFAAVPVRETLDALREAEEHIRTAERVARNAGGGAVPQADGDPGEPATPELCSYPMCGGPLTTDDEGGTTCTTCGFDFQHQGEPWSLLAIDTRGLTPEGVENMTAAAVKRLGEAGIGARAAGEEVVRRRTDGWLLLEGTIGLKACPECRQIALEPDTACVGCGHEPASGLVGGRGSESRPPDEPVVEGGNAGSSGPVAVEQLENSPPAWIGDMVYNRDLLEDVLSKMEAFEWADTAAHQVVALEQLVEFLDRHKSDAR